MIILPLLESSDALLGKINKQSLPQQTLMELLIEDIENKNEICGTNRSFTDVLIDGFSYLGLTSGRSQEPLDVSKWQGVTLNAQSEVTSIYCHYLTGTLHLEWLPSTVTHADFSTFGNAMGALNGTIDTSQLPESLRLLAFNGCDITGEFDLRHLPSSIDHVDATSNFLTGSVNLENLPETLTDLFLSGNMLSGTVCLTQLPSQMTRLYLNGNRLSGSIDVTRLPKGLRDLSLNSNAFAGSTDFSRLPDTIVWMNVSDTQLEGVIYCENMTLCHIHNSNVNVIRTM